MIELHFYKFNNLSAILNHTVLAPISATEVLRSTYPSGLRFYAHRHRCTTPKKFIYLQQRESYLSTTFFTIWCVSAAHFIIKGYITHTGWSLNPLQDCSFHQDLPGYPFNCPLVQGQATRQWKAKKRCSYITRTGRTVWHAVVSDNALTTLLGCFLSELE